MSSSTSKPSGLDRLVIESEIRHLLAAYTHNLDYGKVEANAELLAHARFEVPNGVITGPDNIAHFLRTNLQYHEDSTPRTWHAVSNVLIDIESDTSAKSVCYFTVHQEAPGLPLQPIVTGRYIDSFEFVDGSWRFASRALEPRLFGDISHHVAAPAEADAA